LGEIDRIQRVAPTVQSPTAAQHVHASWERGARQQDQEPREDVVELHEVEEEAATLELQAVPEIDEDNGLDIAV
jgi:hypothetical protein